MREDGHTAANAGEIRLDDEPFGLVQPAQDLVQFVDGFDDTDLHKPDPEPIYEALDRLCVDVCDTDDVIVVGDSPADVFAARNAGCKSIGAGWGTLDPELLHDSYPDHFAATPADAFEVISQAMTLWK